MLNILWFEYTTFIIFAHVFIRTILHYGIQGYRLYIDIIKFVLDVIRLI